MDIPISEFLWTQITHKMTNCITRNFDSLFPLECADFIAEKRDPVLIGLDETQSHRYKSLPWPLLASSEVAARCKVRSQHQGILGRGGGGRQFEGLRFPSRPQKAVGTLLPSCCRTCVKKKTRSFPVSALKWWHFPLLLQVVLVFALSIGALVIYFIDSSKWVFKYIVLPSFLKTIMSLYIDQFIDFNTKICKSLLSVEGFQRTAGLLCAGFLNGKTSSHKEGYFDSAGLRGGRGMWGCYFCLLGIIYFEIAVSRRSICTEDVKRLRGLWCECPTTGRATGIQPVRVWTILAMMVRSSSH